MIYLLKRKMKVTTIKVPESFIKSTPHPEKVIEKTENYIKKGKLEDIYIDQKYNLLDGYITYLIARYFGIKKVRVIIIRSKENKQ